VTSLTTALLDCSCQELYTLVENNTGYEMNEKRQKKYCKAFKEFSVVMIIFDNKM
jgi:hypothetical protein